MWLFGNQGFISIVRHSRSSDHFVVRARDRDHLKSFLPDIAWRKIQHTPNRDYAYRIVVTKKTLKSLLAQFVDTIDYTNFKDSVMDDDLHDLYSDVWVAGFRRYGGYGRSRIVGLDEA